MGEIVFDQQEILIRAGGVERSFVVRTPAHLTRDPALLIHLALDVSGTLDAPVHRLPGDIFLAAGHRAASFDMPCHGKWRMDCGESLNGIAAALEQGVDVFAQVAGMGKAVVDACVERKLARPGHIVICGTSRGGLAALHVMAGDDRIAAAALFAPVTHLASLPDHVGFGKIANLPLVLNSDAMVLVEKVAGRPIAIAISTNDPTVSTEHCLRFHAALRAASPAVDHPLYTAQDDSHRLADAGVLFGAAFLLQRCAMSSLVS